MQAWFKKYNVLDLILGLVLSKTNNCPKLKGAGPVYLTIAT